MFLDQRAVRADDFGPNALKRQNISRFDDQPFDIVLRQEFLIVLPGLFRRGVRMLAVLSMIDDRSNWNLGGELSNPAGVVLMEMCQQNKIDPLNRRLSGRSHDTVCIAAIIARPARVDEQRLPARGDKQRGLAALNIDEIDLKSVPSLTRWRCPGRR